MGCDVQSGTDGLGAFLETAPPPCYLVYLLAAGFGLPCSEDALVAWVGSNISKGLYGSVQQHALVLAIVYIGVVASDMITFGIGVLLKLGFFKKLRSSIFRYTDRSSCKSCLQLRDFGPPPQRLCAPLITCLYLTFRSSVALAVPFNVHKIVRLATTPSFQI